MSRPVKNGWWDIVTVKNGRDNDNTKIYTLVGVITYNLFTGISLICDRTHHFEYIAWATGFGLVVMMGAGGTAIKAHTEPNDNPDKE